MIARLLTNTGSKVLAQGIFYKAVAQSVLLYRSESWVATGDTIKVLVGFHNRSERQITGMRATCGAGKEKEYPPVVAEMYAAGLHTIGEYIRRRQATIVEKVACCLIYELCVEAERTPGTTRMVIWWY